MSPTLLHAVARRADAFTPDADLLARYVRERDAPAFEELVRRHGPLVWAVCRHLLSHVDAEDAFQAVFLALVRSAATVRDGRALAAWLHGVAVRVATRARRAGARRRTRERTAAAAEADRPVPAGAWEVLAAAVHEEVQRLPEAERAAFVLCDLQGVSQPDAAARLGWPLGSVSGRLCKARQRLLDRLAARGVAPAAAVGIGVTAGTAGAVPSKLCELVKHFPDTPVAASTAATALARGLLEGVTMRAKLTAAAAVVVAALGLTGGAVEVSKAGLQPVGGDGAQPPNYGVQIPPGGPGLPPGAGGPGGIPGGPGRGILGPGRPGMAGAGGAGGAAGMAGLGGGGQTGGGFPGGAGGPPGMGGPGMGAPGGGPGTATKAAPLTYKFVDVKNDRKEFEKVITQQGKDGWEFCGSERFEKDELVLVFKKPKATGGSGSGSAMPGMPRGPGMAGMSGVPGASRPGGRGPGAGTPGAPGGPQPGGTDMANDGTDRVNQVFKLRYAPASDVAERVQTLLTSREQNLALDPAALAKRTAVVVAEPVSNSVLVSADADTLKAIEKLIDLIDAKPAVEEPKPAPTPAGGPRPGGMGPPPMGGSPLGEKGALNVFTLKKATAEEMVGVLRKLFPNADIVADPRTNTVIARTDEKTLTDIRALIVRLEAIEPAK